MKYPNNKMHMRFVFLLPPINDSDHFFPHQKLVQDARAVMLHAPKTEFFVSIFVSRDSCMEPMVG